MKRFFFFVFMHKDFVDGAIGCVDDVVFVPGVVEKIKSFDGEIFITLDTHFDNYPETAEGRKLPVPHCIKGTEGWQLDKNVTCALSDREYTAVEKPTFGSLELPRLIEASADGDDFSIEIIGLCTDICVVSNALVLKANFPEIPISVDSACCAGVTPQAHEAALATMRSCQIDVI